MVTLMAEQATARDNLVGLQADQLAAQKALIGNQGRLIDGLTAELEQVRGLVEALEAELAKLRAQVGKDSTNSSVPPSQDSIEAKARQKAERRDTSQRERSADRKPGGQPGRQGSGLEPTRDPGRTERAAAPVACPCGRELSAVEEVGSTWAQVWDIAPVQLEKVHWVLPRYRCGCCAKTSTAVVPFASPGAVVYGPNVNAAAVLLASQGNVPVERAAGLMAALLGAPVSTGFVAKALQRLADRLTRARFDEAMAAALSAEPVLGADESPVNVLRPDIDEATGQPVPGAAHLMVLRTPDGRLVWYRAMGSRCKQAIKALGVLDGYRGYLVRDGYTGYQQFETTLAGVQQCCQHVLRRLNGVAVLGPGGVQNWTGEVRQALTDAHQAVEQAKTRGQQALDPDLLAGLRARYDKAVESGRIHNRCRDWPDGNHPGYTLARWLARHAEQVWLFTTVFAVPWTNNSCEQAIKDPKRHQAVSGYWHTQTTLGRYCRIRSYLTSARNHGVRAIDAIHAALTGTPWLPTPVTA
jgi:transposase